MEYTKEEWKRFVGVYQRQDLHEVVVADGSKLVAYTDTESNAHLIAAAPNQNAALLKAREDINWMLNNRQFLNPEVFNYIDEALTKAEGK